MNVKKDFQDYLLTYLSKRGLADKSDRPYIAGLEKICISPTISPPMIFTLYNVVDGCFGVPISTLTDKENAPEPIPKIVTNVVNYIAKTGMDQQGLYRLSASGAKVAKLRQSLHIGVINFYVRTNCKYRSND